MRVALGRVALLLGVVVVAAMGWYGAVALFEDDPVDDGAASSGGGCTASSSRTDVRAAQRSFTQEFRTTRWFGAVTTVHTDVLDRVRERGADPEPRVDGDGFVLLVTYRHDRAAPDLPACHAGVPVVGIARGTKAVG